MALGKRMLVLVAVTTIMTYSVPFFGSVVFGLLALLTRSRESKIGPFGVVFEPLTEFFVTLALSFFIMSVFEVSFGSWVYGLAASVIILLGVVAMSYGMFFALTFRDIPDDPEKYNVLVVLDFVKPFSPIVVTFMCYLKDGRCLINGKREVSVGEVVGFRDGGASFFKLYMGL